MSNNSHDVSRLSSNVLTIVGPTASGKSNLAIEVAKKIPAEIVSADSMQIYKGMDIGTAKVSKQNREEIPHHLIDIVSIKEPFNVLKYQKLAREIIEKIISKKKLPIIVGGTGLYVRAAVYQMDFPQYAEDNKTRQHLENDLKEKGLIFLQELLRKRDKDAYGSIDINNSRRLIRALEIMEKTDKPFFESRKDWENLTPLYNLKIIGLTMSRELLYERINKRVEQMISEGLVDETKKLLESGFRDVLIAKQALGYKEITEYLDGNRTLAEAIETLKKRTRNYAKRQLTWFRREPNIKWFDVSQTSLNDLSKCIIKEFNFI